MNKKQKIIISISAIAIVLLGLLTFILLRPKNYTVSFNVNGGSNINEQIVSKNDSVVKPKDPIKEGYVFEGWYLEGKLYLFDTPVTKSIVLEAKYRKMEETVTVSFDTNGGVPMTPVKIEKNSKLGMLESPKKDGYIFDKWVLDGKEFNLNTPIDKDITLKATYIKVYKVTFNTNGGSNVNTQIVKIGEKAVKPSTPTKNGYTFNGWFLNNKLYNFNSEIKENIILVAKWTKNEDSTTAIANTTTSTTTTKKPTTTSTTTTSTTTTKKPTTTSTTTTKKIVKTYSYIWGNEVSAAGQAILYIVDETGARVSGTVTVTYVGQTSGQTMNVPAEGLKLVKSLVTISNVKGN